ncbi:hypothetical protein NKH61_10550 [Mesorhizobium sp. M1005]|uniref:hypothetical protein n=1 Tax=unclassified Mesorhizobium TaxID=325217 RepID=UPI0033360CE6
MAKIKNDPTKYQKREVSAPMSTPRRFVTAIDPASGFFTSPVINGRYLDLSKSNHAHTVKPTKLGST